MHVVGDHQAGQVVPLHNLPGQTEHLLRRCRVKGGGVLVQQQQLGRHHGGHQQGEGLALAAREQANRLLHPVLQPHVQPGELLPEQLLVLPAHPAEIGPLALARPQVGQGHVLLNGHVGRCTPHGVLEQTAQLTAAAVSRQIGDVLPVQGDVSLIGEEISGNGVEHGGLAGAVGAHDGGEITRLQLQGQVVQCLLLVDSARVEGLGQVIQLQHVNAPPFLPPWHGAFCSEERPTASGWAWRWPVPPRWR